MLLNILAYVIIPVYTILFTRGTDLFTMNFSVIGSADAKKNAFLLLGIIVGIYYYYTLTKVTDLLPRSKKEKALYHIGLVLLGLAVTTPYLPDDLPLQAFLHVLFAFSASVMLLICLYSIIWKLYRINAAAYGPYLTCLNFITALSASLLYLAGIVSSALEIFFTVSSVILLRLLYQKVMITGCSSIFSLGSGRKPG